MSICLSEIYHGLSRSSDFGLLSDGDNEIDMSARLGYQRARDFQGHGIDSPCSYPYGTNWKPSVLCSNISTLRPNLPAIKSIPCGIVNVKHLLPCHLPRDVPLVMEGLGLGHCCPRDLFKPVIRDYPSPYGRDVKETSNLSYLHSSRFIEHVDVATIWKGMSFLDAEMLFAIHKVFQASLEYLLADATEQLRDEFERNSSSSNADNPQRMFKMTCTRQLSLNRSQLIQTIIQRLKTFQHQPMESTMQESTELLQLYLSSTDCLMDFDEDDLQDMAVEVCLHYETPLSQDTAPKIVAEVAWIPDLLSFESIHEVQREGQNLIIIPHYHTHAVFTATRSPTIVRFSIESSQTWLTWDERISGFRGIVPMYSEMQGIHGQSSKVIGVRRDGSCAVVNTLRVELKALLTVGHRPYVRFERTIRTRLTFKIIPWYAHNSACAPSDDLVKPFGGQRYQSASPSSLAENFDSESDPERASFSGSIMVEGHKMRLTPQPHYETAEPLTTPHNPQSSSARSERDSRKRCASSNLQTTSPTKRHRDSKNSRNTSALAKPYTNNTSISDPVIMMDTCLSHSRSPNTTSSTQSSEFSHLSLCNGLPHSCDLQMSASSDDKPAKISPFDQATSKTQLVHRFRSAEVLSNVKYRERIGPDCFMHTNCTDRGITPNSAQENRIINTPFTDDTSIKPARLNKATGANFLVDEQAIDQSLATNSNPPRIESPTNSEITTGLSNTENGRSRRNSSSTEIILESANNDPKIRREQAILWRMLSTNQRWTNKAKATQSVQELKDTYDAMKLSAEEQIRRELVKSGPIEILDDVFMADRSSEAEMEEMQSNLARSETSSNENVTLGCGD